MVLLVPEVGHALADAATLDVHCAGAESNVALYLADLGRSVAWVSRLGEDPWGDRISRELSLGGVSTSYVMRDAKAPTGVFFKDAVDGVTRVHYYRCGSAASRLSPEDLDRVPVEEARVVHVSGITAAISASAAATAERLLERGRDAGVHCSFDVNYRPGLWPVDKAAPALRDLVDLADVVLVGRDEAQVLWGTTDARTVRSLLGTRHDLVVKDADVGATLFLRDTDEAHFVAAPVVEVVEAVGAGDAFAAGYLAGWLSGGTPEELLTLAHRVAGLALGSTADHVDARALKPETTGE
jgi:2-dehydro-3-deoxygluconokinase